MTNIILATDSYKLGHWKQYPKDTEAIYSYFEARKGARFNETVFFGLQSIIKQYLVGQVVSSDDVIEAQELASAHFSNPDLFNYEGWMHIVNDHAGMLPIIIKAVAEGTPVWVDNVLMTVENTCPKCFWLTNALESLLTHVWAPSTVATLSRETKKIISEYLRLTSDSESGADFMLHDFGYRGVSSHESAAIEGTAHLINFKGTDTLPAMLLARDHYASSYDDLAFSVAATEHSVMTAQGADGEIDVVGQLLDEHPIGILSVVSDSYDIYNFVDVIVGSIYRNRIKERDGTFVIRPDSNTPQHPRPADQIVWILESLWKHFSGEINSKGYKVLNSHVRVLWGDGIDLSDISRILHYVRDAGYSAENLVFGMGGGLLQKINRDTQRFAFKASAIKRNGQWHDIYKKPKDITKQSKSGRLSLLKTSGKFSTIWGYHENDILRTVFSNGCLVREYDFNEVRENALL